MASALNVTALPEYVNEHKDELLVKASAGAKTLDFVEIMGGVKFKDALNYLESTAVLQDGSACGFTPQGTDVFSQRYIEVVPVKVEKEYCWKDFRKTYANYLLNFEAGRETLPFEQKIAEANMKAIQSELETVIWQGGIDGIDGFVALVQDEGGKTTIEEGASATTIIDALVADATSVMLKKGVNIFVSPTLFRQYVAEQNANCCGNRVLIDAASDTLKYVGDSRITIIPVEGLEGASSAAIAATPDALVYGTDIEGADNVYRFWYDEKDDMMRMRVLFNAGTALKWPDETLATSL